MTKNERERVTALMREQGFEGSLALDRPQFRGGATSWVIEVTLAVPVAAFISSFAAEAGKDAYAAAKEWLNSLRRQVSGRVAITDVTGACLVVDESLTEEALDALYSFDWESAPGAELTWNTETRRWTASTD
ncbi:MAG: hypothetical protein ABSC51_06425 [Gaiellaceae bacterium]